MNRTNYATSIALRCIEAKRVPFTAVAPTTWSPQVAKCHDNVDAWVSEHPDCIAVRGWVTLHGFGTGMRLTAHSIVRGPDGALFDITPLGNEDDRQGMRFIPHLGDDQLFNELRNVSIYLDCPNWADA